MPHAPISASHSIITETPFKDAFAAVISFDVPTLFKDHGPLPGAQRVENTKGDWSAVGDTRDIYLTDGSSVHEEVIKLEPTKHAAFRLSGYAAPLKFLVIEGASLWDFEEVSNQQTKVTWTYSYTPRSAFTKPLVNLIVKTLWSGYMQASLGRLKTGLSAGQNKAA